MMLRVVIKMRMMMLTSTNVNHSQVIVIRCAFTYCYHCHTHFLDLAQSLVPDLHPLGLLHILHIGFPEMSLLRLVAI